MGYVVTVYLDPASAEVRRLIAESIQQTPPNPPTWLKVRCHDCGALVGRVVRTRHGPGFTSSWRVSVGSPIKGEVDPGEVVHRSGPPIPSQLRDGVVALLALPPGVEPDYPALLVRCERHGDTVLDRTKVLAWLRARKREVKVDLAKPFTAYRYHDPEGSWLPRRRSVRASVTRRIKATPMPLDALRALPSSTVGDGPSTNDDGSPV